MCNRPFNVGDAVILVGGVCDGLSGAVITAEDAAKLPDASGRLAPDDPTDLWVSVKQFGRMVRVRQSPKRLLHI